jgi:hypothetical protein
MCTCYSIDHLVLLPYTFSMSNARPGDAYNLCQFTFANGRMCDPSIRSPQIPTPGHSHSSSSAHRHHTTRISPFAVSCSVSSPLACPEAVRATSLPRAWKAHSPLLLNSFVSPSYRDFLVSPLFPLDTKIDPGWGPSLNTDRFRQEVAQTPALDASTRLR